MEDDIRTGVEEPAVAGQGEDTLFDKEDFMDEPDVKPDSKPEEQDAPEQPEQPESQDDSVEKAFAERLKHATKKIREEVKEELMREFQQQPQPHTQEVIPPLPEDAAEVLADKYGTTPEVVRAMYAQQALINRQSKEMQRIAYQIQEREEYANAKDYAAKIKKQNPAAPDWDDGRLQDFREKYYKQYGTVLSWRDTYRQVVAEEALNPETYQKIVRRTQQETIGKITSKDKDTVQVQGQTVKKRTVNDLSDEEFEIFLEEAKEGKYI